MKTVGPKAFVGITVTPLLLIALISLLSQPTYAIEEAFIVSVPTGADVYVDDVLIGQTPITYFTGMPFTVNIRVEMEGFETFTTIINVELDEREQVIAVLTPLGEGIQGAITVTRTVTTTTTTTAVVIVTTTEISEVTEQTGLPTELTYGAIGIAIISTIAAAILATRKRT